MEENKEITQETIEENSSNKIEVVGIKFREVGKIYYFDPNQMTFKAGDSVIVETQRGLEFATVSAANSFVSESSIVPPLRPVVRFATEEDIKHYKENRKKEIEVFNICLDKIAKHNLEMKLIDTEYSFDNSKLLFYFTAEGRIDFRELVKDLANTFKTRIELRQIGIRDEAKMMGGLGICGRPFCCHSFLPNFVQVSIKMAKAQNLSLNGTKISGACGRLMCCLRYEYDFYFEELKRLPSVDSIVSTPDGEGVVTEVQPILGMLKVKLNPLTDNNIKVYSSDVITLIKPAKGKNPIEADDESDTPEEE